MDSLTKCGSNSSYECEEDALQTDVIRRDGNGTSSTPSMGQSTSAKAAPLTFGQFHNPTFRCETSGAPGVPHPVPNTIGPSTQCATQPALQLSSAAGAPPAHLCMPADSPPANILDSLRQNPYFTILQQELHADLQRGQRTTLTHPLLVPLQVLPSPRGSATLRKCQLEARFNQMPPSSYVNRLRHFYNVQTARIESSRTSLLSSATSTPGLKPSIHHQHDLQQHNLIDDVEQRLNFHVTHPVLSTQVAGPVAHNSQPTLQNVDMTQPANRRTPTAAATPLQDATAFYANTSAPNFRHKQPPNQALNTTALEIMENWYKRNEEHPYPSHDVCCTLANKGGITAEQVKKWFGNRRYRSKNTKPLREIARRRKLPLNDAPERPAKKTKHDEPPT